MLDNYHQEVNERAVSGIPPKPLSTKQVAELLELLKKPVPGTEAELFELISKPPEF